MLKFFNSLSRKIEQFSPLNPPNVGMYTCGPTVYDNPHIGNLRTFLMADTLHRVLKVNGFEVKFVQNITDIEDKIIKKAKEKNQTINQLTEEYTKLFFEDLQKLNILPADVNPKATEHVEGMVKYIEKLIKSKLAYVEKDGSVYFDISEFKNYGKLSQIDKRELKTGTRVLSDEYTKENVQDFALWKAVSAEEIGYDSPWGKGRPGWHIECSVMSQKYLGDTFDIHAGGIDLMFPHHENEIAQSEGKTGKPFVKYFVHGEFLLVDGQKMAKSAGNFYTLHDIEERGFDPLSFRYLILTAHYRDKLNFTWASLEAAQNTLNNLKDVIRQWPVPDNDSTGERYERFIEALNNDLNMPQAVAEMWEMIRSDIPISEKASDLLKMDKILGLKLGEFLGKPKEIPVEIQKLIDEREKARKEGDFEKSDDIRNVIKNLGFEIEDTPSGPKVK